MKAKRFSMTIAALLGVFVLMIVAPVGAKDPLGAARTQEKVVQSMDAGKAAAQKDLEKAAKMPMVEKINVNQADLSTLTRIKGIGHETAQGIITYREEVGSFQTVEDLMKVKGIGEKTLNQIKPFVSFD